MASSKYHPEPYWNEVAQQIAARTDANVIAGDDEPYYRYKRQKFLKRLHTIPFANKVVLEVGSGPGGNLLEIYKQQPKALYGVDIADCMVALARQAVAGKNIRVEKVNGDGFPFDDRQFDVTLTATVLQHNTDEEMLLKLIAEMCRVTNSDIYIFERIEPKVKGTPLCMGRPVSYYEALFAEHQFALAGVQFLNIQASYFVSGAIRKLFNARTRKEGAPASMLSHVLQKLTLPVTAALDPLVPLQRELAMLHFQRQ